jgi:hypothetical protein
MKNKNMPSNNDLPSKGKLIRSTILAIVIAIIILVTAVLPAEYGVDLTGIGELIGLARMGQIKMSLAEEAAIERETKADSSTRGQEPQETEIELVQIYTEPEVASSNDVIAVTLEPHEGKEIKLTMVKGSTVNYSWYTDGGKANFDAHADSKKHQVKYHNYEKGKLERSEGVMEAAFDGNHGWFWRNRTSTTMTVTLEIHGSYTDIVQ